MSDWAPPKYVSFTTFRRDGTPVATPVWLAPLGRGEYGFTTDPTSWKVKRLRLDPRVEIRPSTMRGAVAPDAAVVTGTARLVDGGSEYRAIVAALKQKYGVPVTLIELGGALKQRVRRNPSPECGVIVRLDD